MTRRKRDHTTADQIHPGDRIIAPNGYEADVDWRGRSENCIEPHVALHWTHPSDFTVNANLRGQSSGRLFRPGDPLTRWTRRDEKARDERS